MTAYTVVSAAKKKDVDGRHGPMQVIALTLRNDAGMEKAVEWFTKATTPLPTPGAKLDGEVTKDEQYGTFKFKKAQQQNGYQGGGGRPRDPQERKSIQAQASQKVAVDIVRLGLGTLANGDQPASVDAIAEAVERVAERLFRQVEALSNG